jgi:hypothetical protein
VSTWHDQMAEAINERKVALAGLERWKAKVAAAEEKITILSATAAQTTTPVEEPAAVAPDESVNGLPLDYAETAQ